MICEKETDIFSGIYENETRFVNRVQLFLDLVSLT